MTEKKNTGKSKGNPVFEIAGEFEITEFDIAGFNCTSSENLEFVILSSNRWPKIELTARQKKAHFSGVVVALSVEAVVSGFTQAEQSLTRRSIIKAT